MLAQGRIRQHLATKAERAERRREQALSMAACAIQSYSRRRSAMLRVLNLAAYRKIDQATSRSPSPTPTPTSTPTPTLPLTPTPNTNP